MSGNPIEADVRRYIDEVLLPGFLGHVEFAERFKLGRALALCESPIEQRLLAALAYIECPLFTDCRADPRPGLAGAPFVDDLWMEDLREIVVIYPPAGILQYRVDLLLLAKFDDRPGLVKVVIECDGHDFHERTKEQAKADRSRDRTLTAAGYRVFRFTGSEIFRDAAKCAGEIEAYLKAEEYRTRP